MDLKQVSLLFSLCILLRVALTLAAYFVARHANENIRILLSVTFIIISFGFGFNIVRNKTKGFFGSNVYWLKSRLLHSTLYLIAGITMLTGSRDYAFSFILIDTLYGLTLFTVHYYYK